MKFSENTKEIIQLSPDFLGFIFYKKSPRYFEETIPEINPDIKRVGVFVNASLEEIREKSKQYALDCIQLHGDETPEFCTAVENNTTAKVIKAFALDSNFDFNILEPYRNSCSYFLFDTKGQYFGGNGTAFDWSILKKYTLPKEYFLSGGVSLEAAEKLSAFLKNDYSEKCFALDLNSKFEDSPGLKNSSKLKEFMQLLKQKL
ncbi:phosphoribosylanthranilate isomerase [Flavobacterium sp. 28YEA47A]|uniref:phosphoribosylanthranilate isomerase n=1 Tax=Flavobacterium sp. 28YEA47A TaxID=3156276 RepID=UPI0035122D49